jgi:hypothetical protein
MKDRPLILVDFDHTLFDTESFLAKAASLLSSYGVTAEEFNSTFLSIINEKKEAVYTFERHIERLALGDNSERALRDLMGLLPETPRFLYADSVPFLQNLRKWRVRTELVTYAEFSIRSRQLEESGLADWLDAVHIISASEEEKVDKIKELSCTAPWTTIIDNNCDILKALRPTGIHCIYLQRHSGPTLLTRPEAMAEGVFNFTDLGSVYEHLEPFIRQAAASSPGAEPPPAHHRR